MHSSQLPLRYLQTPLVRHRREFEDWTFSVVTTRSSLTSETIFHPRHCSSRPPDHVDIAYGHRGGFLQGIPHSTFAIHLA
nr:MAG TPA: hypothetical protein [Caudoviricetes sp.]